jgi:tetratricopeptide (TPR) repeat protein
MAARNEATNNFLSTLITEAAASATPVSVSEMLARSERIASADTGVSAENRAAVLSMIGSYYFTLGDVRRAEELERRALSLLVNSEDTDQRTRIACTHARVIASLGRHAEAVAALERQIDSAASSPITAAECLINRASIAKQAGDAAGALRYAQLALERSHEAESRSTVDEGVLLRGVATGLQLNGRNAEAREYFERALENQRAMGRDRALPMITLRSDWASLEAASGNPRGALKLYDEIFQILAERDANARPPPVLVQNRGRMLQLVGRYDEARAAYESGLQVATAEGNPAIRSATLVNLALVAGEAGDRNAAASYLELADESIDASLPPSSPTATKLMLARGRLDLLDGKFDSARKLFAQVLEDKKIDPKAIDAALGKAEAELLAGDATAAIADVRFALSTATSLQAGVRFSNRTGLSWLMLGRVMQQRGDATQARKAFTSAIDHLSHTVDSDHPALLQARELLLAQSPG